MKNWWIKFGCFLTGYNYHILMASSEVAIKSLKKYTSAMLIVCLVWSFIGFVFTERYLKADLMAALLGGAALCFVIIQIERQIILSTGTNKLMYAFRTGIAIVMALIGSIIVDQIIFQKDIELGKIQTLNEKVNRILPDRTAELKNQIRELDHSIEMKDEERKKLVLDVTAHPTIKSVTTQSKNEPVVTSTKDSAQNERQTVKIVKSTSVSSVSVANPNIVLLNPLNEMIASLRVVKATKESSLIKLRTDVEQEIRDKTGFLDELTVMVGLIKNSGVALFVWLLWLCFLIAIEMFVLVSKSGDTENDYDLTVKHHMDLQKRKLQLMAAQIQGTIN
ncbi:MAG: DUF4407 domain-containing protein [Mucilaginibacter sp.]|nr:DUF4407 domain-containing protein [Mucilaginibacter sp.]